MKIVFEKESVGTPRNNGLKDESSDGLKKVPKKELIKVG